MWSQRLIINPLFIKGMWSRQGIVRPYHPLATLQEEGGVDNYLRPFSDIRYRHIFLPA